MKTAESPEMAARREEMMPAFVAAAEEHGVPLAWLLAFARHETGFRNVRSRKGAGDDRLGGAWGPMQVTSETARTLRFKPRMSLVARGRAILADHEIGINLGAKLLAHFRARLIEIPGNELENVAAAYNAGLGRVLKGKLPRRTRERYVPSLVALERYYQPAKE